MKKSNLWRNSDWEFSKIGKDINPLTQKAYWSYFFLKIYTCAHYSECEEYSNSFSTHSHHQEEQS